MSGNLGGHAARRGTAQDANHLKDDQWKAGTSHEVYTALGHSGVSSLKHISKMYADRHVENLERARETLLPHVTTFTNVAIRPLKQDPQPQVTDLPISTATKKSDLWSLFNLEDGLRRVETELGRARCASQILDKMISGASSMDLSPKSRNTLNAFASANAEEQAGLFA